MIVIDIIVMVVAFVTCVGIALPLGCRDFQKQPRVRALKGSHVELEAVSSDSMSREAAKSQPEVSSF